MLYDIGLRITYSYDRPAVGGRHLLAPDAGRICQASSAG